MEELHNALRELSPTDWKSLPKDDLASYLSKCFHAGELLCNTVPPVPGGEPPDSAQPHFTTPNSSKFARDVHASSARPYPPAKDHQDLSKNWGKPMKFSKKENPLDVALYKMAGHDRHGAWYARHSVEEGLGFSKFKKALMREFPESMLEQGSPGAGAKRGLSAERRVERIDVKGVGRMEVYQLTAQMPSPVTPREFLTLFMSTDNGLTEKSAAQDQGGSTRVPRHFMVVSRPLEHSDAPQRASFVRGQYESVELIREVPLHSSKDTNIDAELFPVEWIMVTRSDPAGGVPRFLVDRGTPSAMLGDVTKFLDWACGEDEIPDPDEDIEEQQQASEQKAEGATEETEQTASNQEAGPEQPVEPARDVDLATSGDQQHAETPGLVSNLTSTLETGVGTYAPAPVADFVHRQLHPEQDTEATSESSSSSSGSFLSAEEMKRMSTAPESPPYEASEKPSVGSIGASTDLSKAEKKNLSQHDREVLKIMHQREKLDQKLAKKRKAEEDKLKQSHEKEASDQGKARDRMEKEMQKTQERHRKDVEKLEARREKELKKAEERRKKKDDQNKLSQVVRERDDFRRQSDLLTKENDLLREQIESLQRENTALAGRLGKLGGAEALKGLQDEIGGRSSRASTMKSGDSASQKSTGSS